MTQTTSSLVQRHAVWSYRPYQNFGQIDNNLHYYAFDDVKIKPPISEDVQYERNTSSASARNIKNNGNAPC